MDIFSRSKYNHSVLLNGCLFIGFTIGNCFRGEHLVALIFFLAALFNFTLLLIYKN
jgi:hypothetical protein